ncbi:MAG: DUF2164 domain-containing protein [Vicinamibacterales bacterium]|nr:DUF2164 domain-containing protein [Vicinamibacterales bacterium]
MSSKPGEPTKLEVEAEQRSVASIKRFFEEHMDEDIGDLKAKLLLDFFLAEIAPSVYNGAVNDAQAILQERVVDLDGVCYQDEFGYWR